MVVTPCTVAELEDPPNDTCGTGRAVVSYTGSCSAFWRQNIAKLKGLLHSSEFNANKNSVGH